jgi:hypothetical protein
MLDAHINGKENSYSNDANSKERFVSAAQFIAQNSTVPQPLVGFDLADGLSVLDGNHRMTALCYCQANKDELLNAPEASQKIWIGTHPRGETPD